MRHRLLAPIVAIALVAACTKAFSPEAVSGTYVLRKVDGQNLPSSTMSMGVTTTVVSGGANLSPNLSYTVTLNLEIDDGMTVSDSTQNDMGTYVLIEPDTITFTGSDGMPTSTTKSGNTISVVLGGQVYEFERL